MKFEEWQGEFVKLERRLPGQGWEALEGKVKASKNGALILIPTTGKKLPIFIEYHDIIKIRAEYMKKIKAPQVTEETVREHLFAAHGWNSPYSTPTELMFLHDRMHRESDSNPDGPYGHIHL